MTTAVAMEMVRIALDEVGVEYYDTLLILQSLEEAQFFVLEQCWGAGLKTIVGPQVRRTVLNGVGRDGLDTTALIGQDEVYYVYALNVKQRPTEPLPQWSARWVEPEAWLKHLYPNPSTDDVISGRLEYSFIGTTLFHNGADGDCEVFYVKAPFLPTVSTPLAFDDVGQAWVIDVAAKLLQQKAVDEPAHEASGIGADTISFIQQQQKQ